MKLTDLFENNVVAFPKAKRENPLTGDNTPEYKASFVIVDPEDNNTAYAEFSSYEKAKKMLPKYKLKYGKPSLDIIEM